MFIKFSYLSTPGTPTYDSGTIKVAKTAGSESFVVVCGLIGCPYCGGRGRYWYSQVRLFEIATLHCLLAGPVCVRVCVC